MTGQLGANLGQFAKLEAKLVQVAQDSSDLRHGKDGKGWQWMATPTCCLWHLPPPPTHHLLHGLHGLVGLSFGEHGH